jgi:hypothetical protein
MSARRWGTGAGGIAAAALCVVLAACGPADGGGAAGLQSVGQVANSTVSSVAASASPTVTSPATAPALASRAAKPTATSQAPKPPKTSVAPVKPAAPAKAASSVTASVGAGSIRYGDQSAFTVTVKAPKAASDSDLSGHVAVLDGGAVVVEGDTDAAGTVSLGFLNTADPGSRTYTVRYDGNSRVAAARADVPVTTTKTNVDIAINWTDGVLPGADATITADIIGTPQSPGGRATISVDGTVIADGALSADGLITGTVKAVTAGDHRVEVAYAGDVRFDPNTAAATLTVTAPPVNPNQAGAAAAQANNPCPAAASACVDLTNEQAWLQSAGKITYGPVPMTSGMDGYRTGTGMFSVFWLDKDHKSSIFNNAPMPNSVFFDNGIAFHEGSLSDQSHGCIHLSWDASETFFDTLSVGDGVYVWGTPPY